MKKIVHRWLTTAFHHFPGTEDLPYSETPFSQKQDDSCQRGCGDVQRPRHLSDRNAENILRRLRPRNAVLVWNVIFIL